MIEDDKLYIYNNSYFDIQYILKWLLGKSALFGCFPTSVLFFLLASLYLAVLQQAYMHLNKAMLLALQYYKQYYQGIDVFLR